MYYLWPVGSEITGSSGCAQYGEYMESVSVSIIENHTRRIVLEVERKDGGSDGEWVGEALREFAVAASGFDPGLDRYQVWISAYLSQVTFMWPIEFSRLIVDKGWTVVFDLND